ncbi:ATP-binding protein [Variovorax sp. M-6]|uniref:ATP-binding protein n=1 Tax=Variovorax sp. M-6 TaxID=3233041 RepID=UPI003F96A4DE
MAIPGRPHQPARPTRPGWLPAVDSGRCTGCGWCVAACGLHLLSLEVEQWRKTSTLRDADRCTGCSDCAVTCPFHAIAMRKSRNAEAFDADLRSVNPRGAASP